MEQTNKQKICSATMSVSITFEIESQTKFNLFLQGEFTQTDGGLLKSWTNEFF